jgi:hypothetical protein
MMNHKNDNRRHYYDVLQAYIHSPVIKVAMDEVP